jgi:hypothetical protein
MSSTVIIVGIIISIFFAIGIYYVFFSSSESNDIPSSTSSSVPSLSPQPSLPPPSSPPPSSPPPSSPPAPPTWTTLYQTPNSSAMSITDLDKPLNQPIFFQRIENGTLPIIVHGPFINTSVGGGYFQNPPIIYTTLEAAYNAYKMLSGSEIFNAKAIVKEGPNRYVIKTSNQLIVSSSEQSTWLITSGSYQASQYFLNPQVPLGSNIQRVNIGEKICIGLAEKYGKETINNNMANKYSFFNCKQYYNTSGNPINGPVTIDQTCSSLKQRFQTQSQMTSLVKDAYNDLCSTNTNYQIPSTSTSAAARIRYNNFHTFTSKLNIRI